MYEYDSPALIVRKTSSEGRLLLAWMPCRWRLVLSKPEKVPFLLSGRGEAVVGHLCRVEVGELTGTGFVVLDGVTIGERVVTAGINNLSDGLKVRLLL